MAKEIRGNEKTRPHRKIKLNRSIFNPGSQRKPLIRGKNNSETSNDAEEIKTTEIISSTTTNNINVSPTIQYPALKPNTDTRRVVKIPATKLLQPAIKLTRLSAGNYSRSVTRVVSKSQNKERHSKSPQSNNMWLKSPPCMTNASLPQSPAKKRKISPVCSPVSCNIEQIETEVVDWGDSFDNFQVSTNVVKSPSSPALSIGAELDDDLQNDQHDERVFIKNSNNQKNSGKKRQAVLKSPISPVEKSWSNISSPSFENDKLDVMSVLADDDDLFKEDRPKLKRSLSQDSIFNMNEEKEDCGDLRSLLKKHTGTVQAESHDIPKKRFSKSFKIPLSRQNGGNIDLVNGMDFKHAPHTPQRIETNRRGNKGLGMSQAVSPQALLENHLFRKLNISLQRRNVGEVYLTIKNLDQMNIMIQRQLLEETLKICERMTCSNVSPAPIVVDTALTSFHLLKKQGDLVPADYIFTIIVLARFRKVEQAMNFFEEMVRNKKLPTENMFHRFLTDFCTALVISPSTIIQVILNVLKLPFVLKMKNNLVNSCLAVLLTSEHYKLQEMQAEVWNKLITGLCTSNNSQGMSQVSSLMTKFDIILSTSVILQLIKHYQSINNVKLLVDLLNSNQVRTLFDNSGLPTDVKHYIMNPKIQPQEIECCFANMIKEKRLPSEQLLEVFIQKASSVDNYNIIYQLFVKCEMAMMLLPVSILQQMMDVLDKWDDNTEASVKVYAVLRKVRKLQTKGVQNKPHITPEVTALNTTNSRECTFFRNGYCRQGDRCDYVHNRGPRYLNKSEDKLSKAGNTSSVGSNSDKTEQTNNMSEQGSNRKNINGDNEKQCDALLPNKAQEFHKKTKDNTNFVDKRADFMGQKLFTPLQANANNLLNSLSLINQLTQVPPPRQPYPILRIPPKPQPLMLIKPFHHHHAPKFANQAMNQLFPGKKPAVNVVSKTVKSCPISKPSPTSSVEKIGRSFSWEQSPTTSQASSSKKSPIKKATFDKNNNGKVASEKPQNLENCVRSKDWSAVYSYYLKCKEKAKSPAVHDKHLLIFRHGFVKSPGVGKSFNAFVDFIHKECSSSKSCQSSSSQHDYFDQYDTDFIASLGVSLMQKCWDQKMFDEGYEVLLCLHNHNVTYFNNGTNFGAYTEDIPPTNVAMIAVKLCLGIESHGCLSAIVVLNACNYGLPEDGSVLCHKEELYRVKVLKELIEQLLDQGFADESIDLINNMKGSPSCVASMYGKMLEYCITKGDYKHSFAIWNVIQEAQIELNKDALPKLYEGSLRHCIEIKDYEKAISLVHKIEEDKIEISHVVFREMLHNLKLPEEETLARAFFNICKKSDVYPVTFAESKPWLCELGCGLTQVELKLLLQEHLRGIHEHLNKLPGKNDLLSNIKDLEISLYPRLASNDGTKYDTSNKKMLKSTTELVEMILQREFNPPLEIVNQSGIQFHKIITVGGTSIYRWLMANLANKEVFFDSQDEEEEEGAEAEHDEMVDDDDDDVLSKVSLGSDLSDFEVP